MKLENSLAGEQFFFFKEAAWFPKAKSNNEPQRVGFALMFHFWIYFFLLISYAIYLSLALGFGNTEGTDSIFFFCFFFFISFHFNCSSFDVKLRFQILKDSRSQQFSQQGIKIFCPELLVFKSG